MTCAGDRLMILLTDSSVALNWQIEQVVLGGHQWACNATRKCPHGIGIYVKIARIFFPTDGQVIIHHLPAGYVLTPINTHISQCLFFFSAHEIFCN